MIRITIQSAYSIRKLIKTEMRQQTIGHLTIQLIRQNNVIILCNDAVSMIAIVL